VGRTLPSLEHYLATLPGGIDAYPHCQAKASVARDAMQRPLPPSLDLPAPLRALVDQPPPVTAWIPEVHQNALMLAILDTHFDETDVDGFYAWILDRNRRLFSGPLYRALFFVISPERLLGGFQRRWSTFRRGTELAVEQRGKGRARARITTPPHLHSKLSARGIGFGFQAALERAGGGDVRIEIPSHSPTEVIYELSWR
jgi:Protein of unknown function (DUF2378)